MKDDIILNVKVTSVQCKTHHTSASSLSKWTMFES